MFSGVNIPDSFWDEYAQRLNDYHFAVQKNYESGKISLKQKCQAHQSVDVFFADFYLESVQLVEV